MSLFAHGYRIPLGPYFQGGKSLAVKMLLPTYVNRSSMTHWPKVGAIKH